MGAVASAASWRNQRYTNTISRRFCLATGTGSSKIQDGGFHSVLLFFSSSTTVRVTWDWSVSTRPLCLHVSHLNINLFFFKKKLIHLNPFSRSN
jgi:hypothetical protein